MNFLARAENSTLVSDLRFAPQSQLLNIVSEVAKTYDGVKLGNHVDSDSVEAWREILELEKGLNPYKIQSQCMKVYARIRDRQRPAMLHSTLTTFVEKVATPVIQRAFALVYIHHEGFETAHTALLTLESCLQLMERTDTETSRNLVLQELQIARINVPTFTPVRNISCGVSKTAVVEVTATGAQQPADPTDLLFAAVRSRFHELKANNPTPAQPPRVDFPVLKFRGVESALWWTIDRVQEAAAAGLDRGWFPRLSKESVVQRMRMAVDLDVESKMITELHSVDRNKVSRAKPQHEDQLLRACPAAESWRGAYDSLLFETKHDVVTSTLVPPRLLVEDVLQSHKSDEASREEIFDYLAETGNELGLVLARLAVNDHERAIRVAEDSKEQDLGQRDKMLRAIARDSGALKKVPQWVVETAAQQLGLSLSQMADCVDTWLLMHYKVDIREEEFPLDIRSPEFARASSDLREKVRAASTRLQPYDISILGYEPNPYSEFTLITEREQEEYRVLRQPLWNKSFQFWKSVLEDFAKTNSHDEVTRDTAKKSLRQVVGSALNSHKELIRVSKILSHELSLHMRKYEKSSYLSDFLAVFGSLAT